MARDKHKVAENVNGHIKKKEIIERIGILYQTSSFLKITRKQ